MRSLANLSMAFKVVNNSTSLILALFAFSIGHFKAQLR